MLGALIAVNLKNSLKQLADPYYLWKKSKLDCVSSRQAVGTCLVWYPRYCLLQPHKPVTSVSIPLVSCSLISMDSVAKLDQTLCNPMDSSLTGSSAHGTFQARILEWVAISSSRGSSQLRY